VGDGQGIAGYIVGAYDAPPSKHGWNANGGQFCVPDMLAGVGGIHLGANDGNHGGLRFWSSRGFTRLVPPLVSPSETTVWFGRTL
jgi:hypothetical protein